MTGKSMPSVRLKRGREKAVLNRHPWIYSGAIASVGGSPEPGAVIDVHSSTGQFLARGYYNPRSQIVVRILTWDASEEVNQAFWRRRLSASFARRQVLAENRDTTAYRLVYAESDGLPGLIVDRYDDRLVLQSLTLGIELWKPTLVDLLLEMLEPRGLYERSDADVRTHEGLQPVAGHLAGAPLTDSTVVLENGLRFQVNIAQGHKTGFYLDQRDNRRKVADYCGGRDVLDVFCYTGGFAVYAGAQGANRVTNVDSSREALRVAKSNVGLNRLERDANQYVEGNAFQVLRAFRDQGREFDLVILDPPKFAFSRAQINTATRGYKDINMLGMHLLRSGGILCTFSCSGLVSQDLFQKVLFGASIDARREVRILDRLAQSSDHPVLLSFPESAYLKGFICQVE